MSVIKQFEREEGRTKYAYLCPQKKWTIGIGFNLERDGANEVLRKHGVNPDLIWAAIEETKKRGGGRKAGERTAEELLTDAQIDALFAHDIADVLADLRVLFKNFDKMPEAAQDVLADMRFQLGPTRLRGFKNTIKAFAERRWKDAAAGMRASLAYKQTTKRWERNAKKVEALAQT